MTQPKVSILVVDDEDIAEVLSDRFEAMGHEVDVAKDGRAGLDKILSTHPDVVFLDLLMPELSGMEVLEEVNRHEEVHSTIVVMTAYGTIERAVQAMRAGAYDFLTKPLETAEIERVLNRAIDRHSLCAEKTSLADDLSRQYGEIVTDDPKFLRMIEDARRAARTNSTILLLGESGTGKELFARQIHRWSPRRERPFVAVNSVALPETLIESELFGHEKGAFTSADRQRRGRLEMAQGGTLFLDEIGDLSEATQAKLLRVLQDREFQRVGGEKTLQADVRIVAATNTDLKTAVDEGRFRADLYFRLNVVAFRLPPLRERAGNVRLLAEYFLEKLCREVKRNTVRLDDEAMNYLEAYSWPGNVRELRNVIERVVVLSPDDVAGPEYLPDEILSADPAPRRTTEAAGDLDPAQPGYHRAIRESQRRIILETLDRAGGNQAQAAEILNLNRTYLSRLMKQLGLR